MLIIYSPESNEDLSDSMHCNLFDFLSENEGAAFNVVLKQKTKLFQEIIYRKKKIRI